MIISIIIATYNAEATLFRCLESVTSQKSSDVEILVIDAKSDDNTEEIIYFFKNKIDYYISESDSGIYDAWNKGIKVAKGNWIMFIGADDKLLPNALSTYLEYLKSPTSLHYDYISAKNEYLDTHGNFLKSFGNGAQWEVLKKGNSAAHVGSLHNKKKLFETVGLYNLDFKICADYELLLRKKENLKSLFLDVTIAQMQIGGMSFSYKAIKEVYIIRKYYNTVPLIYNIILLTRDVIAFNLFRIKYSV